MTAQRTEGTAPSGQGAPQWLLTSEVGMCPCACIGKRRRVSFVEKTLTGGAGLLRQAMFAEDVARDGGFLQRLEPRVKLLATLILLLATALVRHVPVLLALYGVTLLLAVASRLPVWWVVKRVWLFVPLFTGVMVLPAILDVVTPGTLVVTLWTWDGTPHGITEQGLRGAALIVLRVAVSVSFVVLLTITTPWVRLLAALRSLGVPRMFVLIIGMAYRYLFLLLQSVTDMFEARKARTVGSMGPDHRAGRRFVSASVGTLFGRSHHLSTEVHQAMTARGFQGDARTLETATPSAADAACVVAAAAAAVLVVLVDRSLGL